jgi:sporulation protein YlmC with PRC-barrel domain
MTLGHVYDLDLKQNETVIKDVIIQAQGEVCTRFHKWTGVLLTSC